MIVCEVMDFMSRTPEAICEGWLGEILRRGIFADRFVAEANILIVVSFEHQRYFAKAGWSKADIRSNVIDKYSLDQLNATKFDAKSIMLYAFPKQLIKGPPSLAKKGTRENTDLSAIDKAYINKMYP